MIVAPKRNLISSRSKRNIHWKAIQSKSKALISVEAIKMYFNSRVLSEKYFKLNGCYENMPFSNDNEKWWNKLAGNGSKLSVEQIVQIKYTEIMWNLFRLRHL